MNDKRLRDEFWKLKRLLERGEFNFQELLLVKEELFSKAHTVNTSNNNYLYSLYCEVLNEVIHEIDEYWYKYPSIIFFPMNTIGRLWFYLKNHDTFRINVKYIELMREYQ